MNTTVEIGVIKEIVSRHTGSIDSLHNTTESLLNIVQTLSNICASQTENLHAHQEIIQTLSSRVTLLAEEIDTLKGNSHAPH
jgi:hypothetical protein